MLVSLSRRRLGVRSGEPSFDACQFLDNNEDGRNEKPADERLGHHATNDRRPNNLASRSEEHTSELQSHLNLVCRLLLEKKKKAYHAKPLLLLCLLVLVKELTKH